MKKLLGILVIGLLLSGNAWSGDHKGWLGVRIQEVTKEIVDEVNFDGWSYLALRILIQDLHGGAFVTGVQEGSPADKAGIEPGDIIVKIDRKLVNLAKDLPKIVHEIGPGKTVNIKFVKNKKNIISNNITIGALPYKTGYFESGPSNQDVYPNAIEKAYYEKDCKKYGESITNYSKLDKYIFKGFNPDCNSENELMAKGLIKVFENGKLVRTTVYKESLPEEEVNKIGIDIESIPGSFDWDVKRNAKGVLSGKILRRDIIKKFNDELIEDEEAIFEFLNSKKDGDFINLTIFRPKTSQTFNEKIKITKTKNKKFIALINIPGNEYTIYPMVLKKMADQTTGLKRQTGKDLFLLTSLSYRDTLYEDYNKLYKYYDEVSKTKSSNLPEKPSLKSYFDLIKEVKKVDVAKISETKESENIIPASSGTGFFISKEGHIITNNHVINACNATKVNYQGNVVVAKILARDRINDLALLQADIKPKDIFNISTNDADLLEEIYVAGYPFGKAVSSSVKVTRGVVSALSGLGDNYSNILIDAALQPGNSGGPIIDNKGNVVGIAVSKLDYEKVIEAFGTIPENTNFGIKSSVLQTFTKSNNLNLPQTKSRGVISTKKIGNKIKNATVYLGCWMTAEKIEEMVSKKTFFSGVGKGFDFLCYNSCKDRNDESFCRKQCALQ